MKNHSSPTTLLPALFISAMLMLSGCNIFGSDDDNDASFTNGVLDDVWDIMSPDQLNLMENTLNIPIYRGDNPPSLENAFELSPGSSITFLMRPFVMVNSTVPTDEEADIPRTFNNLYVRLADQDMSTYTIDLGLTHAGSPPLAGTSGFIIGNNNNFTIFGPLTQERESYELKIVHVLSGQIGSDDTLENLQLAIVMVDNDGDPDAIPNDSGRRFIDETQTSSRATWPHSDTNKSVKSGTDAHSETELLQLLEVMKF